MDYWTLPYSIPTYVLTDIRTQSVSNLSKVLYAFLGTEHLTTTAYHPKTTRQPERFNMMIIARVRIFVIEAYRDLAIYVRPWTYVYKAQVHRTTDLPPFSLVHSGQGPGPTTLDSPTTLHTDQTSTTFLHILLA